MGDLAIDTAVADLGDGVFEANLSADWEIWGPMGGYVAACALRAAGASTTHPKPAAFSCHYLGVAKFGRIELQVSTRKSGRAATSQRIEVTQEGRPILDAMAWSVAEGEGLEHDETTMPPVSLPGRPAGRSRSCSPRTLRPRPTRSGRTSTRSRSTSKPNGRRAGRARRDGRSGCGSDRRPPSTIPGSTPPARSSSSTSRAGRRRTGPTPGSSPRSSPRRSTSTSRSTSRPAARTGCCAKARPRCPPAVCSVGPPACGPRPASSTRQAAASASTGVSPRPRA